jgi:hypothetical protein
MACSGTSLLDLQLSIYQFKLLAEKFGMKISIDRTKVMAFKGKEHIRRKICVYNKPIEQVFSLTYRLYHPLWKGYLHFN